MQYEAAKIVTGAMKGTSRHRLMQEMGWEDLKSRRAIHKLLLNFKIVNNLCPSYLVDLLPMLVSERTNYFLQAALSVLKDPFMFSTHYIILNHL